MVDLIDDEGWKAERLRRSKTMSGVQLMAGRPSSHTWCLSVSELFPLFSVIPLRGEIPDSITVIYYSERPFQ